jgi:ABC-type cobalt transport system substrate-binding protein
MWKCCGDELGDFPDDMQFALTDLLDTWRKGEKFPGCFEEANKAVAEIQTRYLPKVWFLWEIKINLN